MLTPDQIRKRAQNRYVDFLRAVARNENIFPMPILGAGVLRVGDFERDRNAINELRFHSREVIGFGYEIEWRRQSFRRFGLQDMPVSVSVPSRDDYTRLIGKCDEVCVFERNQYSIRQTFPELLGWVEQKPLRVVDHASAWDGLLKVCQYLRDGGRPDCYPRELPVNVDTKFIERNKGILSELLPIVAPGCVGEDMTTFETRFGFRQKQLLLRFRLLDLTLMQALQIPFREFAIPLDEAILLRPNVLAVLVIENETTFLTLPALPGTIAIWGAGDAAAQLRHLTWLAAVRLFYWGDMDGHGFETLSTLRDGHQRVESVMMDAETFAKFRHFAVPAAPFALQARLNLTSEEEEVFKIVIALNILLEQERLPITYTAECLRARVSGGRNTSRSSPP